MGTLRGDFHLSEGCPWPLGAASDNVGINFALFSAHAERVELCVFQNGSMRTAFLPRCTDQVWHGYLRGAAPGLLYAYRVYGPRGAGHRFDPEKLLVDPYARELEGEFAWTKGGALVTPKCRVAARRFDWGGDSPPNIPLENSVLYEVHVGGATRLHPDVPEPLRGTYSGLASKTMIRHFKRLGVTALNLLPIHCFFDEKHLALKGLSNYWGYNTITFFVPSPRYAAGQSNRSSAGEFRSMVKALHAEGIEIILDVVFNHTAESDASGPTVSFRGIDNLSYYRHPPNAPDDYENFSGCGNTLNLAHPRVLQLVMDCLRYWVGEMHVDGFRFDLATSLVRDSAFLAAVRQDPLLSRVKLIAEPWDIGPDGYRLGGFPPGWSEWNDRFRDDTRMFWLTQSVDASCLARRVSGSAEIFHRNGRVSFAGVNFVTVHDGFTLRDLVSFNERRNRPNGENNRDGSGSNFSWNCGEEGESDDPAVLRRRRHLSRALLATLFISQGIPLLQGGDEIGRTQSGNNNAYCQDNPITWFDWKSADDRLIEFTACMAALRRRFPQTRQRSWLSGKAVSAGTDVVWWHPEGREMRAEDWHSGFKGFLGFMLAPLAADGEFLLVLMNRETEPLDVHLPPGKWQCLCDTALDMPFSGAPSGNPCRLDEYAVKFLVLKEANERETL
ncbi:MAG: glycogen debranching protein GlgX [Candidatus Accumulibacter sp.]|jgi:glycogen operon protein|nr:glycogen debranching protein GlgX [Accumulibacter sp.]